MIAAADFEATDLEDQVSRLSRAEALGEDQHWAYACSREDYFRVGLDYEDYAPAYCVGYIGHAQYGGEFDDAEKSLCANWLRIKGDSRLSWEEALAPIRAAWNRMAGEGESTFASAPFHSFQPAAPQFALAYA